MSKILRTSSLMVLSLVLAFGGTGCSSSGGGGGQPASTGTLATTATFAPGAPLPLLANVPRTTAIFVDLPDDFDLGQLIEAAIDLAGSLSHLQVARTGSEPTSAPTIEFQLLVGMGDAGVGACASGTQALRAQITGNTDFTSKTVSVDEATMPQGALDVINSGSFTLCASATSSVDMNVNLTGLALAFGFDGNCQAPEGLAGVWAGNYTCGDCPGTTGAEADTIELRITQSGGTAIYQDDGGATYVGSVCGSSFHHLGLGAGYVEYGTFTRTGPTTATKMSTWASTIGPGGGCCEDTLNRTSN